jgi:8-amino-3,8-dideoxy-alpha-D-manno-octulosonate transaminase
VNERLAIEGGPPAKTTPNIHMFPGGMEIGEEERKEILEVLDHRYLFRYYGPEDFPSKVRQLEVDFAGLIGTKYALAVNSCTSALISALVAVGVGPGDEVIVPGYTFFASAASILAAKAIPIIAEVDDSLTLDPKDFEAKITEKTKAVIPVHMRGAPCDVDAIMAIAKKHDIKVVEDVAQACGGTYHGARLGSFGDCNAFSLQYHKIITSGEGGLVVTNDQLLYDRAQAYHDTAACWRPDRFGLPRYEGEVFPGVNFRMSELAGAVALAQVRKLDGLLAGMRRNKKRIKDQISGLPGITFRRLNDPDGDTSIALIFFVPQSGITARFSEALQAEGVGAACMFDKGIPDWHVYAHWKHIIEKVTATGEGCPYTCPYYGKSVEYSPDMCPNTLDYLSRSIQIDIPPQMTGEDCDMIAKGIRKVATALS